MIIVNPSTRQFNIPGSDLTFGVEADAGSERKYFQCPRYVGNKLDIASSFVRINYRNANGEIDSYLVEDITVDGDNVLFSWELYPKVTAYKGQLKFVMCVTGPDTKVAWHTTLGTGIVLEGLEPDYAAIQAGTADVVAQLIAMTERQTAAVADTGAEWVRNVQSEGTDQIVAVQTAGAESKAAAVAEIEAKGASTLATIPGEYTATVNAVQSAANAIRGKVSGEVIRVDDVSPMEHYPVVKVRGKNLVNVETVTLENFTGYHSPVPLNFEVEVGKTYTLSMDVQSTVEPFITSIGLGSKTTYHKDAGYGKSQNSGKVVITFTPTKDWIANGKYLHIRAPRYTTSSTFSATISNVQLEEGSIATDYVPYIDPTTVTVTRCGKNLFPIEKVGLTQSSGKGVVENDVLTITGYLLSYRLRAPSLVGKTITFSCESTRSGEKGGGLSIECRDADNVRMTSVYKQNELSPTVTLVVANGTADIMLFFYAAGSQAETGTAVYRNIQLEISDNTSPYEPYNGETQIPAADGTVKGLKSVSPTMSLLTNTPGVTIDCEYSRDTNKVIEDILNKLAALVGNT